MSVEVAIKGTCTFKAPKSTMGNSSDNAPFEVLGLEPIQTPTCAVMMWLP